MEPDSSRACSPVPLQPISPERVNQQRDIFSSFRAGGGHSRDSSVSDKINQFNTLAMQSKQLERKTADAALKRAMLGREEAEAEMRRYRDEARSLRKQVEEGKDRERKVGERLETVMENYGRAKETYAHTQALWEKEIRRARKETFKSQSVIVKLQEELKSARQAQKSAEESLEREKERSQAREQEAFTARYGLVGCQEQLEQAHERIKVLEQERDAFKSLAKSEDDVAKIAAEGKLPLPKASDSTEEHDEFASPKKRPRVSSFSTADIKSSAASEAEIEELTRLWQWEKQRADRAADHVEYLEAECHLRACSCMKKRPRASTMETGAHERTGLLTFQNTGDAMMVSETIASSASMTMMPAKKSPKRLKLEKPRSEPRRSTIFVPEEGVFRTVSQEVAEAMEVASVPVKEEAETPEQPEEAERPEVPEETVVADEVTTEPPTPVEAHSNPPFYARTPSVDPPSFALLAQQRTSLLSLLEAPHEEGQAPMTFNIPTTPGPKPDSGDDTMGSEEFEVEQTGNTTPIIPQDRPDDSTPRPVPNEQPAVDVDEVNEEPEMRPHTVASFYTTTTKVPLREETTDPSMAQRLMAAQRTPNGAKTPQHSGPYFDINNPALTPTMTREQALAQIRERRGRARSAQGGAITPRKPMADAKERRDVSAPVGRAASVRKVR